MVSEEKKLQVKTATTKQPEPQVKKSNERIVYNEVKSWNLSALALEIKARLLKKNVSLTQLEAEAATREVFSCMKDLLLSKNEIHATGFGKFFLVIRPERKRKVPFLKGEERYVTVKPDAIIRFKSPYIFSMADVHNASPSKVKTSTKKDEKGINL